MTPRWTRRWRPRASETERESTAYQLDAFHKTFNFCMSCRQYTCPNCWNEAEARCLTCAPHLGHEIMPAPFPDLPPASVYLAEPIVAAEVVDGQNGSNGWHPTNGAMHDTEPGFDFAARLAALTALPSRGEPASVVQAEPPAPAPIEAAVQAAPPAPVVVEPLAEIPVETLAEVTALPEVAAVPKLSRRRPSRSRSRPSPPLSPPSRSPSWRHRHRPPRRRCRDTSPVAEVAASTQPVAEPAADVDDGGRDIAERLAALGAAAIAVDAVTPEATDPGRSADDNGEPDDGAAQALPAGSEPRCRDRLLRARPGPAGRQGAEVVVAAEALTSTEVPAQSAPEPAAAAPGSVVREPDPVSPARAVPAPAEPVPAAADVVNAHVANGRPRSTTDPPSVEPPPSMPAAASAVDPAAEPQWPDGPVAGRRRG